MMSWCNSRGQRGFFVVVFYDEGRGTTISGPTMAHQ